MNRATRKRAAAFSLLELVMAASLVVGALVPTMAVMRSAMAKSRDLSRRNLLANYAVGVLESRAATVIGNWTTAVTTGNFSGDGHSSIHYTATCSDAAAQGGIPGELMHIVVRVFDDADGDGIFDAGELNVLFRTKIARLASYENEE